MWTNAWSDLRLLFKYKCWELLAELSQQTWVNEVMQVTETKLYSISYIYNIKYKKNKIQFGAVVKSVTVESGIWGSCRTLRKKS